VTSSVVANKHTEEQIQEKYYRKKLRNDVMKRKIKKLANKIFYI